MKNFDSVSLRISDCRDELGRFKKLLDIGRPLSEQRDLLPLFRNSRNMCALICNYDKRLRFADRIAYEYDLFGDFACDLVVGDSRQRAYVLVELEDACCDSMFVKRRGKATPEWAPRFDHGYSQIVDWMFKLADMRSSSDFEERFGDRTATFSAILILGRRETLQYRERARLRWRQDKVLVDSMKIHCLTFDDLYEDLSFWVDTLPPSRRRPPNHNIRVFVKTGGLHVTYPQWIINWLSRAPKTRGGRHLTSPSAPSPSIETSALWSGFGIR